MSPPRFPGRNILTSRARLACHYLSLRGEGGMQFKKLFSLLRKVDWDVKLSIEQLLLQRKDVLLGIHLQVVLKARRE